MPFEQLKRRDFIALLSGAAATWPLAARAQQRPIPVVGLLNGGSPEALADRKAEFLRGLKETGYVENQNVAIEDHFADFRDERLPELAADLVRHRVSVIFSFGGPAIPGCGISTQAAPGSWRDPRGRPKTTDVAVAKPYY